jgi:hypothetical protein
VPLTLGLFLVPDAQPPLAQVPAPSQRRYETGRNAIQDELKLTRWTNEIGGGVESGGCTRLDLGLASDAATRERRAVFHASVEIFLSPTYWRVCDPNPLRHPIC